MNETLLRALSGAVYVALLVGMSQNYISFVILFGVFLLIALYEFNKLIHYTSKLPYLIGIPMYVYFIIFNPSDLTRWAMILGSCLVSAMLLIDLFKEKPKWFDQSTKIVYNIGYIILPFCAIVQLPIFPDMQFRPSLIITLFILIWNNDTFAYLTGKNFGKRKLFERISPKKTIEGFIGGWIMTVIVAVLIGKFWLDGSIALWVGIATIVSIFSTLGDLIESKFKRRAGVKDSGNIMPGHGGILDRLDSVIFVAPIIYLLLQISEYVS